MREATLKIEILNSFVKDGAILLAVPSSSIAVALDVSKFCKKHINSSMLQKRLSSLETGPQFSVCASERGDWE